MSDLPPLPEPDMRHRKAPDDADDEYSFSPEALQAYARAAVAAALPDLRERVAEAHDASLDDDHTGCRAILRTLLAELDAAAIRREPT